jgi:hypothetical protein
MNRWNPQLKKDNGWVETAVKNCPSYYGTKPEMVDYTPKKSNFAPKILDKIEVTSKNVSITANQSTQFTAVGNDICNRPYPIKPKWHVTNGTIDNTGKFYPYKVGTRKIYANYSGFSGKTTVKVTPSALVKPQIVPSKSNIE